MNALIEDTSEYDGNQKPWIGGGLEKSGMSPESLQYFQFLRETEDSNEELAGQRHIDFPREDLFWTDMPEDDCARGPECDRLYSSHALSENGESETSPSNPLKGVYVNLLENPESYTGYSESRPVGYGQLNPRKTVSETRGDVCLEKRAFTV